MKSLEDNRERGNKERERKKETRQREDWKVVLGMVFCFNEWVSDLKTQNPIT